MLHLSGLASKRQLTILFSKGGWAEKFSDWRRKLQHQASASSEEPQPSSKGENLSDPGWSPKLASSYLPEKERQTSFSGTKL